MDKKKNFTIYDIAKIVQVSPSTVSRVLTNHPLVKESTRQRILTKMEELGYMPNEVARSLTKKQTGLIGLILPDITNPFFSQVYMEIEKRASEKGYMIMLRNSVNRHDKESLYLRELSKRRVECILFMGGRINNTNPKRDFVDEMNEVLENVPLIMVNGKMEGVNCHSIQTDENGGIHAAIDYLVGLGHDRIGLIGGVKGVTTTDMKLKSFRQALSKHGLHFHEDFQIYSGYSIATGRDAMKQVLQLDTQPTALIGINDMVIYGAYKECREQGISMERFSFVGFDDMFTSDIVHPALTTVSHNYEALASEIVASIECILGGEPLQQEKWVDTRLIVRQSCYPAALNEAAASNGI